MALGFAGGRGRSDQWPSAVYCPGLAGFEEGSNPLDIVGDEAGHLGRVRRVREGEVVEAFDGKGLARAAQVIVAVRDRVTLRPFGPGLPSREPSIALTLATAVPKGERFDWLVEKAVEIGISTLVPILTERSVVDPRVAKLDRLRRAVVEASKQCGRNLLMTLAPPRNWSELIGEASHDGLRLVAHPGGEPFSGGSHVRRGFGRAGDRPGGGIHRQ